VAPVTVGVGEQIRILVKLPESARTEDASVIVRNVREIGDGAFLLGVSFAESRSTFRAILLFSWPRDLTVRQTNRSGRVS